MPNGLLKKANKPSAVVCAPVMLIPGCPCIVPSFPERLIYNTTSNSVVAVVAGSSILRVIMPMRNMMHSSSSAQSMSFQIRHRRHLITLQIKPPVTDPELLRLLLILFFLVLVLLVCFNKQSPNKKQCQRNQTDQQHA
jgi:hypothetical protein